MRKPKKGGSIELERTCPFCGGCGIIQRDYEDSRETCEQCGGSGYLATAAGKQIIALIEHNLKGIIFKPSQQMLPKH
jgi:DnaJ-class molecular chaperone